MRTSLFQLLLWISLGALHAQTTEVVYLSGTGFDHTVPWEFYCTAGMNSGHWTTIEVPSCWEQQGFGQYNYGHVPFGERLKEEGRYRYRFQVPADWKGKSVRLVFEGVMTDCRVQVNGKEAGPVHQGGFYRFSYEIDDLLRIGKENTLEVEVKKFSDNMSVNQAERKADYWIFGGIYRPVYLMVAPKEHIERVAVDAHADGTMKADLYLSGFRSTRQVAAEVFNTAGASVASFAVTPEEKSLQQVRIAGHVPTPDQWSPEFPHLYRVRFSLVDGEGKVIHRVEEHIGFRTVEVREEDGIYVNGVRIKFKGVNRHSFHPDNGRTSSKALSIEVVNLIKDMNMNAVRMSHYPPDPHFLDVCDSLGLFVLDELAGWQWPPYDSVVGRKLLREMISRDVNHPSVVMWDNGNEGGWNTAYDDDFMQLDIQQREVNHPWAVHGKTNTAHYVDYNYLAMDHFAPRKIFFPTEVLHGLYDGGLGAGLEDFWFRMWNNPLSAGAFLWVFADESVKRTDTGELDSDGNHAPDGILGPYHEKEGSFYAIREIWSPVHFENRYITPGFNGRFRIQNRFHYTNLEECAFEYRWYRLNDPAEPGMERNDCWPSEGLVAEGEPLVDPLGPGKLGSLIVPLPENWQEADVLYLEAHDPFGRLIHRWSWPVTPPGELTGRLNQGKQEDGSRVSVSETSRVLILESDGVRVEIDRVYGTLKRVMVEGSEIPFNEGPVFLQDQPEVQEIRHFDQDGAHHVSIRYVQGDLLEWSMQPGGLVDMKLQYRPEKERIPYTGASFTYPEEKVRSVRYLGNGPYRVWKNRMAGGTFNVWDKAYNNTITGHSGFIYPEFKGYYSQLYWCRFLGEDNRSFTVYSHTQDLFLRLFTPEEAPDPAETTVDHPPGNLSFMLGIPPIGTKFKRPEFLGPQSREYYYLDRRVEEGSLSVWLTFDFKQ
ncbi:MAG: glycoside hydrolase family 2 protein [Bacteroidales bacterium]